MDPNREHLSALETLRKAKNILILVAVAAPVLHLAAWVAVQFFGVLDARPRGAASTVTASAPADPSAAAPATETVADAAARVDRWDRTIRGTLPLAEFAGRCAMVLLTITLLLAVLVCLSGRLAGVSSLISALYVAVFVGVLFIPWERIAPAETNAFCVFTTVDKLKQRYDARSALRAAPVAADEAATSGVLASFDRSVALDGLRFAALPLMSVVLLLSSGARYGRGIAAARKPAAGEGGVKII